MFEKKQSNRLNHRRSRRSDICTSRAVSQSLEAMESRVLFTALVGFETGGLTGTTNTLAASSIDANISNTPTLTRDAGLTASSKSNGFSSSNWQNVSSGTTNKDIYFDVTPKTGYELSFSELDLSYQSSSTGPQKLEVDYSTNAGSSYTAINSAIVLTNDGNTHAITALSLSSVAALQGFTGGTLRFRLVGYSASSTSGTFGPYNGSTAGLDLQVQGTSGLATAISTINPTNGPAGTVVSISGNGFTGATNVSFGSLAASSFNVSSDSLIYAAAPSGNTIGTAVDIRVISPTGTSAVVSADQFTTLAAVAGSPTITSVSPNSASYAHSSLITITGTSFTPGTVVNFGSTAVTAASVSSDGTSLTVNSPVITGPSSLELTVTTTGGTSAPAGTSYDGFSFTAPTIASFSAVSGDNNVGTLRTLTAGSVTAESGYTITSVLFYLESDSIAGLSSGDTLLGSGSASGGTYTLTYTPATGSLAAGNYTIYVVANSSSGATTTSSATMTVVTPVLSFASSSVFFSESAGNATITVNRTLDTTDALQISYNTTAGTAVAGTDYTSTPGVLTFGSGVTSQTITIPLLDSASQIGNKTLSVNLYGPTPSNLSTGFTTPALVTIQQAARAFAAGDVAVTQVGDGSTALVSSGNQVYLDEYSSAGSLVQSFPLPEYEGGTTTSEGFLSLSSDGHSLVVPGYVSASGSANTIISSAAAVNRAVDEISSTGAINSNTVIPYADFSSNNIRSAASYNGSNIWVGSTATGVRYTVLNRTTASTNVNSANYRNVEIYGNQLYLSTGSGTLRIATVGTGLPTASSGVTVTNLPGSDISSLSSPYAFAFFHLNGPGSTPDTLYVADDSTTTGGIIKFSFDGTNWVNRGTIGSGTNAVRGLTGSVANGIVTLYATTGSGAAIGGGSLYSVTDSAAFGAAPSSTTLNTIATAGSNTAFRGVAFTPVAVSSPTVTSLSEPNGVQGDAVTITGTNFTPFSNVTFGGTNASSVTYISPTSLSAIVPAGSGSVSVNVTTVDGTSSGASFSYISTQPTWLGSGSAATYDSSTKVLTITGATTIVADPGSDAPILTGASSAATVTFNRSVTAVHVGGINLSGGATITMSAASTTPMLLIDSGSLLIDSSSKLDLGNNYFDLTSGDTTTINSLLTLGYNNGTWTGNGITSATAAADATHLTALASKLNIAPTTGTIDGVSLATTDALIKYTYYGDADLTGAVDGTDYSRIDNAVLNTTPQTGWYNGDFNYDGVINGSDYTLIDNAYNTQRGKFATPAAQVFVPNTATSIYTSSSTSSDNFFSKKKVKSSLFAMLAY